MLVYCLLLWPIALKKYSISTSIILFCLGSRTNQLLFTYLCISAYIFGWFIIPWIVFENVETVLVVSSGISGQNKTKKGSPDCPFEQNAFLELNTNHHLVNGQHDIESQINMEPKCLQNDDAKQTKLDLIKIVQPCWTVQVDLVSYVPYCPWIIVGHLQNQLAFYDNDSSDDDDDGCHLPHCSGKSCRPHALASLALSLTYCTGEPPIQARLLYRLWLVPYTGQARFRSSLWLAPTTQKTPACHK